MKSSRLLKAIGEIEEGYILEAMPVTAAPQLCKKDRERRRFLPRVGTAAAAILIVMLISLPVRAELVNGYVSNLLIPLYGGQQTEIVEQIGMPIEAVVEIGDYRLSADAVIGDKYNVAVVYSLTRADGGKLEEGTGFDHFAHTIKRGSGGGSCSFHLNADQTVLSIVQRWSSGRRLPLNRMATATFTDLVHIDPETRKKTVLVPGQWELRFAVRYEDSGVRIAADDAEVTDISGRKYVIRQINVSPIGIHLRLTTPKLTGEGDEAIGRHTDFQISVILEDGTEKIIDEFNFSTYGKSDASRHNGDVSGMFELPIPLHQIREIVICGTSFTLERLP